MRKIDNLALPDGEYASRTKIIAIPEIGDRTVTVLIDVNTKEVVATALEGETAWKELKHPYATTLEGATPIKGYDVLSGKLRCPRCCKPSLSKNGLIGGRQRWKCRECNRVTFKPLQNS